MKTKIVPMVPTSAPIAEPTILQAEPEPLEIDRQRTAIVLIDLQNALISNGGMIDLIGKYDVAERQKIITPIKEVTSMARARGCRIVYTVDRSSLDLHDCGGASSPNWYKSIALVSYREHPEWQDKLLFRNTWGAEIIEELKPQEGDIVIEKQRLSAFFGTNLDIILKGYNIKYLLFGGVTTNICVEAGLRDAYYRDYFPILISDAAVHSGPPFMQEATIFNLKYHYGWVTNAKNVIKAMAEAE